MELIIFILFFILIIGSTSIKLVQQTEVYIVERLGVYTGTPLYPGLHLIIPFIDKVRARVSLLQQTTSTPVLTVTQDNSTIQLNVLIYYVIKDPAKAAYEIQSLPKGLQYLAITHLRDITGKINSKDIINSESKLNPQLYMAISEEAKLLGCQVNRVEVSAFDGIENTTNIVNNSTVSSNNNSNIDNSFENIIKRY